MCSGMAGLQCRPGGGLLRWDCVRQDSDYTVVDGIYPLSSAVSARASIV